MTNARDKANIPVLNFQSKGIDDNASTTSLTIASDGRTTLDATNEKALVVHHSDGSNVRIGMNNNTTNSNEIAFNGTDFVIKPGGTEEARLTSTGLGIGTSSPSTPLHIDTNTADANNPFVNFDNNDGNIGQIRMSSSGDFGFRANTGGTGNMFFQTGGSGERMRIDSGGNVCIGTTSAQAKLHIVRTDVGALNDGNSNGIMIEDTNCGICIGSATTGEGHIYFSDSNDADVGAVSYFHTNNFMQFRVNASERMRIDSSGNFMVGKTATGIGSAGAEFKSDGRLIATVSGNYSALLNRLSSDGDIVQFRKDGTTVGVIGTQNWGIGTSSPASELEIESATPEIRIDATSGAGRNYKIHSDGNELYIEGIGSSGSLKIGEDGTYGVSIDLGTGGIQASDGIYLGGTGTANKLDDYEEGTFTPTYTDGFSSVTYTAQSGYYTKIGDFVFVRIRLENSAATTNGNRIEIGSLPFTTHGSNPGSGFNWSYAPAGVTGSSTTNLPIMYVPSGSSLIKWYNTAGGNFVGGDLNSTVLDIYINGSYQTT
jgi:hypothetical protein